MIGIYARTSKFVDGKVHTIQQQIDAGIDFAKKNNMLYQIFADEGISGYYIDEDSSNPYSNRPQFTELINAIKRKEIDSIWIWENSRLSRNTFASAFIYRILEKNNITLYIQDSKYDLSNPTDKFIKSIMDNIAEYERSMIVSRTTRGLYNSINTGKRSFSKFYGYRKATRNESGNYTYTIDEHEMSNVKLMYKMFLKGETIRQIALAIFGNTNDVKELLNISTKISRILKHKEYTSYTLNMEGLAIERQFNEGKRDDLKELADLKYWVKSCVYTEKIISINDWIKVREKIQIYKRIRKSHANYSSTEIGTGLITCSCGCKYFSHTQTGIKYYKHRSIMNNSLCNQHPKTIKKEKFDNVLGFFYFYYSLIFDDYNSIKEKTITNIREQREIIKAEIKKLNDDYNKLEKVIDVITKKILDNPDNYENDSKRLDNFEHQRSLIVPKLTELKTKLINIDEIYSGSLSRKNFISITNDLYEFFYTDNNEMIRNKLLKIIKSVSINNLTITIKTETLTFIFELDKYSSTPYEKLPLQFIGNEGDEEIVLNFWERFKNKNLDYTQKETQQYLIDLFGWKYFKVKNNVISFNETVPLSEKKLKRLEAQKRYREKLKSRK